MTRDDTIRLAREAGFTDALLTWPGVTEKFERFAALMVENFLKQSGQYLTNDASREAAIAEAVAAERARIMSMTGAEFAQNAVEIERKAWVDALRPAITQRMGAEQVREAIQSAIRVRGAT